MLSLLPETLLSRRRVKASQISGPSGNQILPFKKRITSFRIICRDQKENNLSVLESWNYNDIWNYSLPESINHLIIMELYVLLQKNTQTSYVATKWYLAWKVHQDPCESAKPKRRRSENGVYRVYPQFLAW